MRGFTVEGQQLGAAQIVQVSVATLDTPRSCIAQKSQHSRGSQARTMGGGIPWDTVGGYPHATRNHISGVLLVNNCQPCTDPYMRFGDALGSGFGQ